MDFHGQKVNLSFSIENILRDDFPHPRKTNVVNIPTRAPCFDRWSNAAPVYRCYAVRYSPVFMKYQPSMNRVGGKVHRVNGDKRRHPENIEDDRLRCKDETIKKSDDEVSKKDETEQPKTETCLTDNAPKRKRRNRSHFTQRQLQYLEKIFSRQQYLTRDERTLLARGLEMTELQIRNWFQNQRYQKKHRANENKKQEKPDASEC